MVAWALHIAPKPFLALIGSGKRPTLQSKASKAAEPRSRFDRTIPSGRYVGDRGHTLALDRFGSARSLAGAHGFTVANVIADARKLLQDRTQA